jgi:hypothetical protein
MRAYLRTISISRRYQLNGRRLARALKFAVRLGSLVSCLLLQCTPALAIASYDVFAQVIFQKVPIFDGTSMSLFPSSTSVPPPILIGDATAFNTAGTAPIDPFTPLGRGSLEMSGTASGPSASFAGTFASAVVPGVFTNQNDTTENFQLFFRYILASRTSLGQTQFESAHAHASFRFLVDGNLLLGADQSSTNPPGFFDTGSISVNRFIQFPLTPGLHSLRGCPGLC